jgi:hypothetical protein
MIGGRWVLVESIPPETVEQEQDRIEQAARNAETDPWRGTAFRGGMPQHLDESSEDW